MKRPRRLYALFVLVSIAALTRLPVVSVQAKGPPARIVLRGPGLRSAEIADPALMSALALGQLEDFQRGSIAAPSVKGPGYELVRYFLDAGDRLRAFDHLHYFPATASQPSYIFYDGLNVEGSTGWSEFDGKWYYPTQKGDAVMRTLLERYLEKGTQPWPPTQSGETTVGFYDPDPEYLWNRLHRHLFLRRSVEGKVYGLDALDPLLWYETTHLLCEPSHTQALRLLDEFLATGAEKQISDPLKRAILQRDLWAIFDWLALRSDNYLAQRQALQARLASAMQRLALTAEEIRELPDTYQAAVAGGNIARAFDPEHRKTPYLPPELFQSNGRWVNIGRDDGPTAIIHVQAEAFSGRSVFLVFINLPGGRKATLDYLRLLREASDLAAAPELPSGTQVTLVRQMLLIDDRGELVPTRLTETVQLRVYPATIEGMRQQFQDVFEFKLSRAQLFARQAGGLRPVAADEREWFVFMSHGIDHFEQTDVMPEQRQAITLRLCSACHAEAGIRSVLTYSRFNFTANGEPYPKLRATSPADEAERAIAWKRAQENWAALQGYWPR